MTERHVFLGTSEFAAEVLRSLSGSDHRPELVVTPPDRPRGRGRQVQAPPVADAARSLEIELLQAESVNDPDSLARIRAAEPQVGTVCAFGQLIREPLLSEIPLLNAHPSLLPQWRGAAPIERAIMAGDEVTGVSVIRLVEALDAGPIALSESLKIGAEETFGELAGRLGELSGELLARALDRHDAGELAYKDQDEEGATYAEKITAEDRRLDPAKSAAELAAQVRALTPHIGAYVALGEGERLGVLAAREAGGDAKSGQRAPGTRLAAGELLSEDGVLSLGTGDGELVLSSVQPAGGRPMPADEFLRGHELPDRVDAPTPATGADSAG